MKIRITNRSKRSFKALSVEERKAFKKHIELLVKYPNPPFYPSLRIKKIRGISGIFECSIILPPFKFNHFILRGTTLLGLIPRLKTYLLSSVQKHFICLFYQ